MTYMWGQDIADALNWTREVLEAHHDLDSDPLDRDQPMIDTDMAVHGAFVR